MTVTSPGREGFSSLRSGGLNWDSFPLRLFTKGNAKFWNPTDLDFSQDARDWQELTSEQQRSATFLCAQFIAGEEAVTEDIQPFMKSNVDRGTIRRRDVLDAVLFRGSQAHPGVSAVDGRSGIDQ